MTHAVHCKRTNKIQQHLIVSTTTSARQKMLSPFALLVWLFVVVSCLDRALCEPRLAKPGSTHPSFPLDAFARPAYKVVFQDHNPIGNQTALEILRASREETSGKGLERVDRSGRQGSESDGRDGTEGQGARSAKPFRAYLHRTSPDSLHVCTLAKPTPSSTLPLRLDEDEMRDHRAQVIRRALSLLAPLKNMCLYHTLDWFTYSLCYGDAVKQFRALSGTVGMGKTPTLDPTQDSYVLGRWRQDLDVIRGDETSFAAAQVGDGHDPVPSNSNDELDVLSEGKTNEAIEHGSELLELVHFASIDGTDVDRSESGYFRLSTSKKGTASVEGKGRYISQIWSDGTLCNINNEPRTSEVQFHCAKQLGVDRIALIKEVTTCNYVVVVETPRLCGETALAQAEEEVHEIHCRPILSEEALQERYLKNVQKTQASLLEGAKEKAGAETHEATARRTADDLPLTFGSDTTDAVDETVDEPTTESPSSFQSQLSNLIEEVMAKSRQKREGATPEDVEVIVGMDEHGNLVLEPRGESLSERVGKLEADGEDTLFYDAPESQNNGRPNGKGQLSGEKWTELVEQIKKLGLIGNDGALYQVVQGAQDEASVDTDAAETKKQSGNAQTDTSNGRSSGRTENVVKDPRRAALGGQGAARRGSMVRETETFAQRVDRIYRAQEQEKKKEDKDGQADGGEGQGSTTSKGKVLDRDEL